MLFKNAVANRKDKSVDHTGAGTSDSTYFRQDSTIFENIYGTDVHNAFYALKNQVSKLRCRLYHLLMLLQNLAW